MPYRPTARLACTFTLCCTSEEMPLFWLAIMMPAADCPTLVMLLAMLNDPAMMEAARALGQIMAKEGLEAGFRRVTARLPNPDEKKRLLALRTSLDKKYKADPAAAKKVGGNAAWTMVANVLLNMDEAITKE